MIIGIVIPAACGSYQLDGARDQCLCAQRAWELLAPYGETEVDQQLGLNAKKRRLVICFSVRQHELKVFRIGACFLGSDMLWLKLPSSSIGHI